MEEINSNTEPPQFIVLFDGLCNLCNQAVNFIIDRDPKAKFQFASLQSETGKTFLRKHHLPTEELKSLVLLSANKYYIKSKGALTIARHLSGLWPLMYIFIVVPRPIRDFFYDLVAKYRYKIFGKSDSCRYPTAELKSRFLD